MSALLPGQVSIQGGAGDPRALDDLGFGDACIEGFTRRARDLVQRLLLIAAGAGEVLAQPTTNTGQVESR